MFHHFSLSNPDLSVPFVTFLPLALRQSIRFRWKAQTLFQHLSFCSLAAQLKGQVLTQGATLKIELFRGKNQQLPIIFSTLKICYLELNCLFFISQFSSIIWCIFANHLA